MGFDKLSFDLGGETVLERSVRAFDECPEVDELVIVTGASSENAQRAAARCKKPVRLVKGGSTRAESARSGVASAHGRLVAVHDAARPFVSQSVIADTIAAAARCGAAAPAVPVKDTIKQAKGGNGKTVPEGCMVENTPDRSTLYAVQTPQCFDRAAYLAALDELDEASARLVTDDCSLFELTGRPVELVQGDYANIKITTREDLPRTENGGKKMRIGHGYDVHRLVEGRKLILGGVEVPYEKGLLGHSDADVLAHAVMDAVLGAAALGDIGQHFPDTAAHREHRRHDPLPAPEAGPPHPGHAGKAGRGFRDAGGRRERQSHHRGASGLYRRGAGHRGPRRRPHRSSVNGRM